MLRARGVGMVPVCDDDVGARRLSEEHLCDDLRKRALNEVSLPTPIVIAQGGCERTRALSSAVARSNSLSTTSVRSTI